MDFIVVKVNGRDLSKASHEEAVEAFCSAKEPIVVEVVRKASVPARAAAAPSARPNMASPLVTSPESSFAWCESSTQTEWTGGWESSPPVGVFPFSQTSLVPTHQVALFGGDVMEHHYETLEEVLDHQDGEEDDEDEDEEDEEGCDLEYEEITLRKSHCDEKLGLTLCYASPDDGQTDIFVSEIEPNSLASRDGRVMEGDQLLQINGVDVHNRRQAVDLFSNKGSEITILVARPHLQEDEDDEEDDGRQESANTGGFPIKDLMAHRDVDAMTSDAGTMEIFPRCEKDSGVGRTDGSTRNDESTDQEEVPDTPDRRYFVGSIRPYSFANGGSRDETCSRFPASLDQKCASTSTTSLVDDDTMPLHGDKDSRPPPGDPSSLPRVQSDNSLDREMAILNQEMQNIQVECESLVSRHIREQWFRCHAGHSYVTYGELTTAQQQALPSLSSFNNLGRRRQPEAQPSGAPPPPPPPLPPPPQARQLQVDKKESVAQWVKSVALDKKHKGVFSKLFSGVDERDSSSAYHTGDSSRSTPLTLELAPIPNIDLRGSMMSLVSHPKLVDKSTQLHESDVASVVSCDTCQYCQVLARRDSRMAESRFSQLDKHQQRWGVSSLARTSGSGAAGSRRLCALKSSGGGGAEGFRERNRNYVTFYPCATMYTNQENLQHTIWLQQQLFRQALAQKHYKKSSTIPTCAPLDRKELFNPMNPPFLPTTVLDQPQATSSRTLMPPPSNDDSRTLMPPPRPGDDDSRMEWKVKRRPDGTRYITRRPVRNKILKERAMKITEERCGLTTDDDAVSELKVGRYWSKEERKRHLEKSRDRKQRKEILLRSKMTSVRERQEEDPRKDSFADGTASSAANYYYKKTTRRKMKIPSAPSSSVMDDFVEPEPSSHSAKGSSSGTKSIGILSVTTV